MRAAIITKPGGLDVLEVREVPTPEPGAEQLLVRVHATALNRADLLQRRGLYPPPPGAPADIPGLEYAGEVAALGPGAREWRVGDRVYGLVGGGGHAEYVVVHERTAARIPDSLSWAEAAAVPEAYMTAHDALVTRAGARPGESVLVHAAGSGVGLAALQLARALGMRPVLGTARTATKLDRARAEGHGLDAGLTLEQGDVPTLLVPFVYQHTGGRGVDVALDLVGGPYLDATVQAMAPLGRIVLIGTMAGGRGELDFGAVLRRRLTLRGTVMRARPLEERIETTRRFAAEVGPLLASGAARPVIDARFPLAEIGRAHARLEGNETFGKVVIEP